MAIAARIPMIATTTISSMSEKPRWMGFIRQLYYASMSHGHSLAHHFTTEAYNNAWANHRLLKACCALSQEDFVAPRTSFFPSIKATLNHNLTVDWYYLDIL